MNRIVRKSLYFIAPLVVCLSLAGTGFCLWIFNEDNSLDPKELGISVNVASATTAGAFDSRSLSTNSGPIKIAQQGYVFPKMLVFNEGKRGGNPLAQGLNFYKQLKNVKEVGKEHIFDPSYPTFKDEIFLSDTVLLTYYRDASIPLEELASGGLEFNLTLNIKISNKLSEFITIFNTYDMTVVAPSALDDSTTYKINMSNLFELDKTNPTATGNEYNNLIKQSLGYKVKEAPKDILTLPNSLISNLTYEKRNFNLNFSQFFRWTSDNKKPTTAERYKLVKELCDTPNQYISFIFEAGYKEIKAK